MFGDLRIGDIILIKGLSLISEAIEDIEHSPYSHTAGYVGDEQLIEANGFRRTGYQPVAAYTGCADVFRCDYLAYPDRKRIVELAEWAIGGHYDFALLFVELIRYAWGVMLPYREPPNSRICSTLWAGIYRDVGIDLCPGIRYPSPADLAQSKLLRKVGSL